MDELSIVTLQKEIDDLEQLLAAKKRQFEKAQNTISKQQTDNSVAALKNEPENSAPPSEINQYSSSETKIALFRSLFKGREDVYAKRFESKKTGKSGYQPVCKNEWVRGICEKPNISCNSCTQRSFESVTDEVFRNHLAGFIRGEGLIPRPSGACINPTKF